MEHVRVDSADGVAVVTLVDVERRNAMTARMVDEIVATFDALESDGTTAAVVVTGEAPAFCSGADVSSLGALARAETDEERRSVTSIYEGFLRVLRSPLPTIAAVNGPAVGAGMNLALACDVRLAGASARFDTRFVKIGLHPGGGHVWMLERAVGPQAAAAMVLFGVAVDGARAAEIGLAWSCHPDDELLDAARTLAARATRAPVGLLDGVKATLRQAPWQPDFEAAIATEVARQAWSLGQGWFPTPSPDAALRRSAVDELAPRARGRARATPRRSSRSGCGLRTRPGSARSAPRCPRRAARASRRRAGSTRCAARSPLRGGAAAAPRTRTA